MKTPDQWLEEYDFIGGEYDTKHRFIPIIQAIQKDAVEEGRRRCFWELDRIQAKENASKPNP